MTSPLHSVSPAAGLKSTPSLTVRVCQVRANPDRQGGGGATGWAAHGQAHSELTRCSTLACPDKWVVVGASLRGYLRGMDRFWFFTWRTHGTWLPGSPGFVGNYVTTSGERRSDNIPGELTAEPMPALEAYARDHMSSPPVYLTAVQAGKVIEQLHETARYRGRVVDAVAVMTDHIHLVFGTTGDPDPGKMMDDWKAYASRALNKLIGWSPPAPRPVWWVVGGSKRIVRTEAGEPPRSAMSATKNARLSRGSVKRQRASSRNMLTSLHGPTTPANPGRQGGGEVHPVAKSGRTPTVREGVERREGVRSTPSLTLRVRQVRANPDRQGRGEVRANPDRQGGGGAAGQGGVHPVADAPGSPSPGEGVGWRPPRR